MPSPTDSAPDAAGLRILHVTPSFYPAHVYGGPIKSTYALCAALAHLGCQVRVLTTNTNGLAAVLVVDTAREQMMDGFAVRYCRRQFRHSVSVPLLWHLPEYANWADLIHLTGVYNFTTFPALLAARRWNKPLVWSTRGALQRWAGSRRPKLKSIWELAVRDCAPPSLALHVTSEEERAESLDKIPGVEAAVIPNGVDIPPPARREPSQALRLLFIGRIDPKKGIENLLAACRCMHLQRPWSLVIAGGGERSYVDSIRSAIDQQGLAMQVHLAGEVEGEAKERVFHESDLCLVPSYTENFAIVVAEALARGVPVIASRGTPWRGLEEHGCGLWIENDPPALAAAIERLAAQPLECMGRSGREWMQRDFSWDTVGARMLGLYAGQVHGKAKAAAR